MEIAKFYEADAYIASEEEDVIERCKEETEGEGPDIVVTTCGSVEAHEQAVEMVAHRGYVNLFGGLPKTMRPMSVLSNVIHYKECFVTGSHGCVPRHHELAVRLLEKGLVRVKPLITHHFPLIEIDKAFEAMESRQGNEDYDTPASGGGKKARNARFFDDLFETVPDFPRAGIIFKDITPLLGNPTAFHRVQLMNSHSVINLEAVDVVAGTEARGFVFGAALAYRLGAAFVPIRKKR